MTPRYSSRPPHTKRRNLWLLLMIPVLVAGGIFYWIMAGDNKPQSPQPDSDPAPVTVVEQPEYTATDLQPVVEAWVANKSATYGIVVYDPQAKRIIGFNQPEKVMFAASLYKIFVAYFALQDFQTGAQNPDDILIAGQTKRQCVDKMIRSSDSPCGESMMAEIGQAALNRRAAELGAIGTFFNGIRTSAQDSALILQKILEGQELNQENTAFLLDAMLTQEARFKRGLQTGAPEATWNTKVGWNEDQNYHDIGIMTMPDGRKFVVAILSDGQGSSAPIADFARTIYAALAQ